MTRRSAAWREEIIATLRLAWPLVLSNLASTALTAIDVVILGRAGPQVLAAGALGTNLFMAVLVTSFGIVTAVSPLLGLELGRRPYAVREVRRTFRQGLWAACCIFVPAWVILGQGDTILVALGQDPTLSVQSALYLRALSWSLLPTLGLVVQRALMAALGRQGWGLAISLAALPMNTGLAWVLVFGHLGLPALGLVGAGWATTITAVLAFGAGSIVLVTERRFRRYRIFGRFWRPDWPRFASIWKLGLPIAATLGLEVAFFSASGLVMGRIGTDALAAHTIALQVASLCFMVPLGVAQAATIRVGYAFGAGDVPGTAKAGWSAFAVAMTFELATASLLLGLPGPIVGAFLDVDLPSNAAVVALAVRFLGIAALFQLADGAQVVGAGMLRGLKDTRWPMAYAALGYWLVGMPLGWAMAIPAGLGGTGLWIGLALGLGIVALLVIRRWSRRDRLGLMAAE